MKKILLVGFLTLCSTFAKSQNLIDSLPEKDGRVTYESIVDMPGKTKDVLFLAAKKWIIDIPDHVRGDIQIQDKEQGQVIGDGSFKIQVPEFLVTYSEYLYNFKIQIDCKDNKYRIRLSEIKYTNTYANLKASDRAGLPPIHADPLEAYNADLKKSKSKGKHKEAANLDAKFKKIMASLETSMNKGTNDDF